MSKSPVTIIVATFPSDGAASAALDQLKSSKKDIGLKDAAIVRRDGDKVKVKETKDMGGGKGAVIGGVLAGIATGGLSILAGAVGGGLIAKLHDANLSNKDLKALGQALPEGQDAVLAVVDEASGDKVTEMLKQAGAVATTVNLDADTLARLTAPAEEAATEEPAAPAEETVAEEPAAPAEEAPAAE